MRVKESPGTSLVVSFLIRYPELSSVRFCPETERLTFRIFLKGIVELTKEQAFIQYVETYVAACRELEPSFADAGTIRFERFEEGATALCYEQRIQQLDLPEVRLFMELARQDFEDLFSDDKLLSPYEEEVVAHEAVIERILQDKNTIREEKPIVGYREGGRVFVFNR